MLETGSELQLNSPMPRPIRIRLLTNLDILVSRAQFTPSVRRRVNEFVRAVFMNFQKQYSTISPFFVARPPFAQLYRKDRSKPIRVLFRPRPVLHGLPPLQRNPTEPGSRAASFQKPRQKYYCLPCEELRKRSSDDPDSMSMHPSIRQPTKAVHPRCLSEPTVMFDLETW